MQEYDDFELDMSVDETESFLQKVLEEKTEKEITKYFCERVKKEADTEDLVKAWKKWKEINGCTN